MPEINASRSPLRKPFRTVELSRCRAASLLLPASPHRATPTRITSTPRKINPPCRVMTRSACCAINGVSAPTAADVPRHTANVMARPSRVSARPKNTRDTPQLAPNSTIFAKVPPETAAYVDQSAGTVSNAITWGLRPRPERKRQTTNVPIPTSDSVSWGVRTRHS